MSLRERTRIKKEIQDFILNFDDICEKNNLLSPCQQIHYPIAEFMYLHKKAKLVNNENNTLFALDLVNSSS